ncbi:MotA/TolQ/ExbB proton channel family protein [Halomonas eurihalina]|uniref:MotA/TolQ/ExbB proton channel family protein n=1 Tax=Halomonas eurihalina TaxID=42566 RepID=A0A5D9CJ39_HALER|nr:MotA/TolQ/ExbB proton channel family protein [Halomonas eurihalina]MDR5860305.1 MotA/TolQ/ExbB proton channel family protein [Halomonas eurihalina]TZG32018.1 MotA/TolQ/ExbB proton channel family protein [Halomonas eurihalina]
MIGRHPVLRALAIVALAVLPSGAALAQSSDEPLQTFQAERKAAEARDRARLAELVDDRQALESALQEARSDLEAVRERRQELEAQQQSQKAELQELASQIDEQGGDLGPVFDEVASVSGELRDDLGQSWLTLGAEASLPPRLDSDGVLRPGQVEILMDSLMGMTRETSRIVNLSAPVAGQDGQRSERAVTRIGDLLAFSEGQLLQRTGNEGDLSVLDHTPGAVSDRLNAFQAGQGDVISLDPTDGQVLEAMAQQPSLLERFQQGGAVGYVVVVLGVLGLLVALFQYLYLLRVTVTLKRQLGDLERLREDNPLGRVLKRFHALGTGHAPEALEARLDEAMLAEQPRLERGQPLVKMLAAVAPLLGLLGTVTGMIVTFQSITVFGTGDPQLMAGGISQALVTTVLGLITAVPLLFAHTALSSRSRALIGTMEGRASAVLADRLEADQVAASATTTTKRHVDALA